jgi:pimeloyl-ACP methyl ester carboxylesterase
MAWRPAMTMNPVALSEAVSTKIRVVDGINLNVRVSGVGRPALVMLHGFGDGEFVWNTVLPVLTDYGSVVTVDLRGHGESDRASARSYVLESYVADVLHVIRVLDLGTITLVGHSLGAAVALCITAKAPDLVRRLALLDGGPGLNAGAGSHIRKEFASQPWRYASIKAYESALTAKLPLASSEVLHAFAGYALRVHPEGGFELKCDRALASAPSSVDDYFLWSALRSVKCPTLLLRGEGSAVLPLPIARRILAELSCGRLETIPHAGHAVLLDNPTSAADRLARFIEEHA